MKKQLLFLGLFFVTSFSLMAQTDQKPQTDQKTQSDQKPQTDFVPSGAPIIQILWNYTEDQTPNVTKKSGFGIDRSYFGYKYELSSNISTKIVLDAGPTGANTTTVGSAYTVFVKNAVLDWRIDPRLTLRMGMQFSQEFQDQEDFWGYRYIFKSFDDQNGFAAAADLGINAEIKILKTLRINLVATNGEGYKNLQDANGRQKVGGNIIFTPIKGLITKIYFDDQPAIGSSDITSMALFAGYKADKWRIAAEYNKLNNASNFLTPLADHNLNGVSFYGTYVINKKIEILGRFDQLKSNTLAGASTNWNIAKDGNQIIGGLQYNPVKGFKLAFNYQGYSFNSGSSSINTSKYLLNAEFRL